jgi:hypothetical protein
MRLYSAAARSRLPQMAMAGMWLNVALVPIILGLVWILAPFVFDLQIDVVPEWARNLGRG